MSFALRTLTYIQMGNKMKKELDKPRLKDFKYVGGGYYRLKEVKKGVTAPMLHGQEVIEMHRKEIAEVIIKLGNL